MKKRISLLVLILIFSTKIFSMESINDKTVEKSAGIFQMAMLEEASKPRQQKCSREFEEISMVSLPIDIIVLIGENLLNASDQSELDIKDHLNFAWIIRCDERFFGQDIRDLKAYLDRAVKDRKTFAIARRLKIKLSDQEKEQYKNLIIQKILAREEIAPEKLSQWLTTNLDNDYNNLFKQFFSKPWSLLENSDIRDIKSKKKKLLIILLALLTKVDPNMLLDEHGRKASHRFLSLGDRAQGWKNEKYASILLAVGADPENRMIMECRSFSIDFIKALLLFGVKTNNIMDWRGNTPLLIEMGEGWGGESHIPRKEVVKLLLKFGANPNVANEKGVTALDKVSDPEVASILLDAGAKRNLIGKGFVATCSIIVADLQRFFFFYKTKK